MLASLGQNPTRGAPPLPGCSRMRMRGTQYPAGVGVIVPEWFSRDITLCVMETAPMKMMTPPMRPQDTQAPAHPCLTQGPGLTCMLLNLRRPDLRNLRLNRRNQRLGPRSLRLNRR